MTRRSPWLLGATFIGILLASAPEEVRAQSNGVAIAPTTSDVAATTTTTYTARRGDTLRTIAKVAGVALAVLQKANPQIRDVASILLDGDRISIPPRTPPFVPASTNTPAVAPTNKPVTTTKPAVTTTKPAVTTTKPAVTTTKPAVAPATAAQTTPAKTDEPGDDDATPDDARTLGEQAIDAILSGTLKNPNLPKDPKNWVNFCRALIREAFKQVMGKAPAELSAGSTAWESFLAFQKAGKIRTDGTPPPGAIVFWSPQERARIAPRSAGARAGHVAISDGAGTCISNVRPGGKYDTDGNGIGNKVPLSAFGRIAGYVVMK